MPNIRAARARSDDGSMMHTPIRTIIVDDEHLARRRLRALLASHRDFEVVAECEDGVDAVQLIQRKVPDLVFLDIRMMELDGLDVARAIAGARAPLIVFVSAYDRYAIDAFGVSATDYLLKPFDEERFVAALERVRDRLAQNRGRPAKRTEYRCGDIEMDVAARIVRRAGDVLTLRPKEFELLLAFMKRPGIVITRGELLEEVWGYHRGVMSRTVDTHVGELRRKLKEPECIKTVARIGYRLGLPTTNGGTTTS